MSFKPLLLTAILISAVWPAGSRAEYRVFLLRIGEYGSPPPYRTLESTLAPRQYTGYHRLNAGEVIDYVDTWMCWGRTGAYKPHCPSPRAAVEVLEVAPPIGQGYHPWAPHPIDRPAPTPDTPGITTRTPAEEQPPEPQQ